MYYITRFTNTGDAGQLIGAGPKVCLEYLTRR